MEMLKNSQKLTMEELRNLKWEKVSIEFLEDFDKFDFYTSDIDNDGISDDIELLKRAVLNKAKIINGKKSEVVNPVTPILYGSLRTILTTRKTDKIRENLKVYFCGVSSPTMIPDVSAYQVHKWHLVEDSNLNDDIKYSYFETNEYLIVIRHNVVENDSCFVFIYEKTPPVEEEKKE